MEKFYSPQWRWQTIEVPPTGTGDVTIGPSFYFANDTVWDWELVFLSVVGTANLDATGLIYTTLAGGVMRRLEFNVGISQQGDINLVWSNGQCMFGPDRPYIVHSNDVNSGLWFGFDPRRPYQLPPDAGIGAIVQNRGAENIDNLGILLTGYEQPDGPRGPRNPVHIGGHAFEELAPGGLFEIDHADMYNDGEHPCTFTDMNLNGFMLNESETSYDTMDQVRWRVNPSVGPLWMPDPSPIPVGCIAPFNYALFDANDEGPRAYVFPDGSKLKPRQRVSVAVRNRSSNTDGQLIHVCLFGYLEVT